MKALKISLWIVGALAMLATLAPLLQLRDWKIRAFDFPRVQIVVVLLAIIAAYAVVMFIDERTWKDAVFVGALVMGLTLQLVRIIPYTPLVSPQAQRESSEDTEQISLVVANVLLDNRETGRLIEMVRAEQPDLLLVVETDQWWLDELAVLHDMFPYRVGHPLDNTYGMALYSSLELIEPEVQMLIEDDVPSISTRVLLASGVEVQLYCLHPRPPTPAENPESTERDAELLVVGAAAKTATLPVIVAGDMNDVAWSHTTRRFQRISGLLDPRIGRGIYSTYNAKNPLLRWPLDHTFFSDDFHLVEMRRLGRFGSDHFPMLLRLSHNPAKSEQHEEPDRPDADDRQEAAGVIEDATNEPGQPGEPGEPTQQDTPKAKVEAAAPVDPASD